MPSSKITEDTDDTDTIMWDTNPLTMRPWLNDVEMRSKAEYKLLYTKGATVSGRKTVVNSAEHARAIVSGNITLGTFQAPFARSSYPVTSTALTAEEDARFQVAPELVDQAWTKFASFIARSIGDKTTRKDYLKKANDCGSQLLINLFAASSKIGHSEQASIGQKYQKIFAAGITTATVEGFSLLRTRLTELNEAMPANRTKPDSEIRDDLVDAARRLGDTIEQKVDFEIYKEEAEQGVQRGQLDLDSTVECIRRVLGAVTAKTDGDRLLGQAMQAGGKGGRTTHDPRKHPEDGKPPRTGGHPDRAWDGTRDRNCSICDGGHWDDDCAHKNDKAEGARLKAKRLAKKANAAAAKAESLGARTAGKGGGRGDGRGLAGKGRGGRGGQGDGDDDESEPAKGPPGEEKEKPTGQAKVARGDVPAGDVLISESFFMSGVPATARLAHADLPQIESADEESSPEPSDSDAASDVAEGAAAAGAAGAAMVAACKPKARAALPASPVITTTPQRRTLTEMRASIDGLRETTEMKTIRTVLEDSGLSSTCTPPGPVSPHAGGGAGSGPSHGRCRRDIIREARACAGLDPLPVPLGTPVDDTTGDAAARPQPALDSGCTWRGPPPEHEAHRATATAREAREPWDGSPDTAARFFHELDASVAASQAQRDLNAAEEVPGKDGCVAQQAAEAKARRDAVTAERMAQFARWNGWDSMTPRAAPAGAEPVVGRPADQPPAPRRGGWGGCAGALLALSVAVNLSVLAPMLCLRFQNATAAFMALPEGVPHAASLVLPLVTTVICMLNVCSFATQPIKSKTYGFKLPPFGNGRQRRGQMTGPRWSRDGYTSFDTDISINRVMIGRCFTELLSVDGAPLWLLVCYLIEYVSLRAFRACWVFGGCCYASQCAVPTSRPRALLRAALLHHRLSPFSVVNAVITTARRGTQAVLSRPRALLYSALAALGGVLYLYNVPTRIRPLAVPLCCFLLQPLTRRLPGARARARSWAASGARCLLRWHDRAIELTLWPLWATIVCLVVLVPIICSDVPGLIRLGAGPIRRKLLRRARRLVCGRTLPRAQRPLRRPPVPYVPPPSPHPMSPWRYASVPPPPSPLEPPPSPPPDPAVGRACLGTRHERSGGAKRAKRARFPPGLNVTAKRRPSRRWTSFTDVYDIDLTLDSGCTWHVHPHVEDLVNRRPCDDRISAADGEAHGCSCIGDLPVVVKDHLGYERAILLRNVRCVPSFVDTLVSIDQLWEESRLDVVFRDVRRVEHWTATGAKDLLFPFVWTGALYHLRAGAIARSTKRDGSALSAKDATGTHRADATTHVAALSPNDAADLMQRRLHIGLKRIRALVDLSSDAPQHLRKATFAGNDDMVVANATRLPHSGSRYRPTYAGRMIHADIVGPFVFSHGQGYQYALVLVDDHTRFKMVYFLKKKSEAPARVSEFVARFNRLVNSRSKSPARAVGHIHSDNAGEFLSREFKELLADNHIDHTTCPPHVHQLNGVAERAIRSLVEQVRSNLEASKLPISFWPYLMTHGCDVLNRTTGPPNSGQSSYEMLTGDKPKVMNIPPIGCRATVVRPEGFVSKTNLHSHGWSGENLGREPSAPGSFNVWVPSTGRVHCTSEVYFTERYFPRRPEGDRFVGPEVPVLLSGGDDQPPGIPTRTDVMTQQTETEAPPPPPSASSPTRPSITLGGKASNSRAILLLFSGPYDRPDGLMAFLNQQGFSVVAVDNDVKHGGGEKDDVFNDDFYLNLLRRAGNGEFLAIIAAPPCSTFSVARFFDKKDAPPPVRTREFIEGLSPPPARHARELRRANRLVRRMAHIVRAGFNAGAQYVIENPCDHGDPLQPHLFMHKDHGPLWLSPVVRDLIADTSGSKATFAQCRFGADYLKYTTFAFSAGFAPAFNGLDGLACNHGPDAHRPAGGVKAPDGSWNSSRTAAFPADLNLYLARAVASLVTGTHFAAPPAEHHHSGPGVTPPTNVAGHTPALPALATPPPLPPPTRPPPSVAVTDATAPSGAAEEPAAGGTPAKPRRAYAPRPAEFFNPSGRAPVNTRRRSAEQASLEANLSEHLPSPTAAASSGAAFRASLAVWLSACRGRCGAALAASSVDPTNRRHAMSLDAEGWTAAELSEIENHRDNGSFETIPRGQVPPGRKLVNLTWAYKVKRSGKLKARLCVQGCSQVPGVDYDQTWSGTMRSGTLRMLAATAAREGLQMRRWDFVAAYLQGSLLPDETLYCRMPPGHPDALNEGSDSGRQVLKVVRPIYGMAQAGRRWQRTIYPYFEEFGFKALNADSNVFVLRRRVKAPGGHRDETLILGCYVDDLFVLYSHADEHSLYHQFTSAMAKDWRVDDEGPVADLLGVQIEALPGGKVKLHQSAYIDRLMATHAPDGCPISHSASKTPACDRGSLQQHLVDAFCIEDLDSIDPALRRRYQSLVGALLYCSCNTRPDVAFAVSYLSRAMARPTPALMEDALRVLYYLHRHKDVGLTYESSSEFLHGFSDSDWGVPHSTSGYVFQFQNATISWGSKKQVSVALSSCEAELMAGSEAAKEAIYLRRFSEELGHGNPKPTRLGMDNQAGIAIAYNPEMHSRTKHIHRRHFFIRELVEDQQITVPYVHTSENCADFFTKSLSSTKFFAFRDKIMNVTAVGPNGPGSTVRKPPPSTTVKGG